MAAEVNLSLIVLFIPPLRDRAGVRLAFWRYFGINTHSFYLTGYGYRSVVSYHEFLSRWQINTQHIIMQAGLVQGLSSAEAAVLALDLGGQVEAGLRSISASITSSSGPAAAANAPPPAPTSPAAAAAPPPASEGLQGLVGVISGLSSVGASLGLQAAASDQSPAPPTEAGLHAYGITASLKEFVAGLTVRTFRVM